MTGPNPLALPGAALDHLNREITTFGARGLETGAFLLAPTRTPDRLTVVALTGDHGITRRPDQLTVAGEALERLFGWAEDHQLQVRAQVHSHGGRAFLSLTDRTHGLNVEGFVTTVVPTFATPPRSPSAWGWWRYFAGGWTTVQPATVGPHAVSIVTFDSGGVRDP